MVCTHPMHACMHTTFRIPCTQHDTPHVTSMHTSHAWHASNDHYVIMGVGAWACINIVNVVFYVSSKQYLACFATWHLFAMAAVTYVSLSSESEDEDVQHFSGKKSVAKIPKQSLTSTTSCQVIRRLAKLRRSSTWTTRRKIFKEYQQSYEKRFAKAELQRSEEAFRLQLMALMRPDLINTCNLQWTSA